MEQTGGERRKRAERQGAGRGSRVAGVSAALRRMILSGAVPVGGKLPSELTLAAEHRVSRTVVREAISSLRADGLVKARQGAGVFVTSADIARARGLQRLDPSRISSVIEMLELRAAVEIEAAALASQRRSPGQAEAIHEAWAAIETAIAAGAPTADPDFAFHIAIAEATNNARFREFLTMLGESLIPRRALRDAGAEMAAADYLAQIQAEHLTIAEAIARQDEPAAREAMRIHLTGSAARYRRFIRGG